MIGRGLGKKRSRWSIGVVSGLWAVVGGLWGRFALDLFCEVKVAT